MLNECVGRVCGEHRLSWHDAESSIINNVRRIFCLEQVRAVSTCRGRRQAG